MLRGRSVFPSPLENQHRAAGRDVPLLAGLCMCWCGLLGVTVTPLQKHISRTPETLPVSKNFKTLWYTPHKLFLQMAKDKYEQAAMTDITKENDAASASAQGQVMFNDYAKLADALSGTKGFNNLYNATTSAEREKDSREKAAIASLRQEEKDLHKLEMEKRNLRHAEQAKAQVRANAEEKANIENELSGITNGKTYVNMYEEAHKDDAAKQFADAKAIKEAREERDAYRVAQKKDVVSAKELNAIDSNVTPPGTPDPAVARHPRAPAASHSPRHTR